MGAGVGALAVAGSLMFAVARDASASDAESDEEATAAPDRRVVVMRSSNGKGAYLGPSDERHAKRLLCVGG